MEGGAYRKHVAKQKKWLLVLVMIPATILLFFNLSPGNSEQSQPTAHQQLAYTLSQIEGIGKVELFIHTAKVENSLVETNWILSKNSNEEKILGVLVVCEGGKSITVQQQLKEVVGTILQIPSHRIVIEAMGGEEE